MRAGVLSAEAMRIGKFGADMKRAIGLPATPPVSRTQVHKNLGVVFVLLSPRARAGHIALRCPCSAQAQGVHCAALSCFAQALGVPPCTPVRRSEAVLHYKAPPNPCTPV